MIEGIRPAGASAFGSPALPSSQAMSGIQIGFWHSSRTEMQKVRLVSGALLPGIPDPQNGHPPECGMGKMRMLPCADSGLSLPR